MNDLKIDYKNANDVDIIIDGEKLNGISAVDLKMNVDEFPKATFEITFPYFEYKGPAAISIDLDSLNTATRKLVYTLLKKEFGNGSTEGN